VCGMHAHKGPGAVPPRPARPAPGKTRSTQRRTSSRRPVTSSPPRPPPPRAHWSVLVHLHYPLCPLALYTFLLTKCSTCSTVGPTVVLVPYASPCSVSQRSHCLRSRSATPTAVFATAPAPEAANDSAAAASARRSSAEGIVADAAVSAACAERSKASRPSAIGPSCHWDLLSLALLENNGLEPQSPSANLQLLLTADPARPLAARRPQVPRPASATSYTFAIFSTKHIHSNCPVFFVWSHQSWSPFTAPR